jgi:hypothetical protein
MSIAGARSPHELRNATLLTKTFFNNVDPYFKLAYSAPPFPASFMVGIQKAKLPGDCHFAETLDGVQAGSP